MRRLVLLILIYSLGCAIAGATPVRSRDGIIQFAIATVGGIPAFTAIERDAMIAANPAASVVSLTPTALEVAISTTFARFGDKDVSAVDDFRLTLTSKSVIVEKAINLANDLVAVERIQQLYPSLNVQPKINRLLSQINLLVGIWGTLP